jgi:hypothetical protein
MIRAAYAPGSLIGLLKELHRNLAKLFDAT